MLPSLTLLGIGSPATKAAKFGGEAEESSTTTDTISKLPDDVQRAIVKIITSIEVHPEERDDESFSICEINSTFRAICKSLEISSWRDLFIKFGWQLDWNTGLTPSEYFKMMNSLTVQERKRVTSLKKNTETIEPDLFDSPWNAPSLLALKALPPNITEISRRAFRQCRSLALTELPAGVTEIHEEAFMDCKSLMLKTLPEGITEIEDYVFYGCTELKLTALPNGITEVGVAAFADCSNMILETLPEGITEIGDSAFLGCASLMLTTLPEGITEIRDYVFWGCKELKLTALPKGITEIGETAFLSCTNLMLETLPEGLHSIGKEAFADCIGLQLTALPANLNYIGDGAFYGCIRLPVHLQNAIKHLNLHAFDIID